MKKLTFLFLFLLTTLTACGKPTEKSQLFLAPTKSQDICMLDGKLLFEIQCNLYYADDSDGILTLKQVEGEAGNMGYEVSLHEAADGNSIYIVDQKDNYSLIIDELSKDYEKVQVSTMENELMDWSFPIVSDGICYYVKGTPEGKGGLGRTLKMFDLADSEKRPVLYIWEDLGMDDYLTGLRKYDQYLVMTLNSRSLESLWVYDTQKQEMIISGDEDMAGAAYMEKKLYYIEDATGNICTYDLKQQKKLDNTIPVTDYTKGVTLACDKDYIYVNQSIRNYEDITYESSNIQVYSYDGKLVDTIDLSENKDAVEWDVHTNPYYCVYLGSTEDYIFIGRTNFIGFSAVFYVEKSQIGSGDMEIRTLYLHQYDS